jgi:hypothetical protein
MRSIAVAVLVLFGLSCGGPDEETITELSIGCLDATADEVVVHVMFETCLSSSCDTLESAECTLEPEGDGLTVTGTAVVTHSRRRDCTADCGLVEATCSAPAPSTPYVVSDGDRGVLVSDGDLPATCLQPSS